MFRGSFQKVSVAQEALAELGVRTMDVLSPFLENLKQLSGSSAVSTCVNLECGPYPIKRKV